jgi:hypothetical protein
VAAGRGAVRVGRLDATTIDLFATDRTGENVSHIALTVEV